MIRQPGLYVSVQLVSDVIDFLEARIMRLNSDTVPWTLTVLSTIALIVTMATSGNTRQSGRKDDFWENAELQGAADKRAFQVFQDDLDAAAAENALLREKLSECGCH